MIKTNKEIISLPVVLLVAAFLPYLSPSSSIKGDDIIIFGIGFINLIMMRYGSVRNKHISLIAFFWSILLFYLIVITLLRSENISVYSLIAELENFILPLLIMIMLMGWRYSDIALQDTLETISKLLILLLSINTLWILLGFVIDLTLINKYFVRQVSFNAATMGRYTGIFNQPIEVGIAYSLGLLSWLYLNTKGLIKVSFVTILKVVLLIVGGIMSVSKAFIFGGFFLFGLNVLVRRKVFFKSRKMLYALMVLAPAIIYYMINCWNGFMYFSRLFNIAQYRTAGIIRTLTAGRFGVGSDQQKDLFLSVWNKSPIFGLGLGSQIVYDSAFFHMYSSGGIVALLLYVSILAILIFLSFKLMRRKHTKEEGLFLMNVTLLILLSSFGAPVLTLNRTAVILWVFICIIFISTKNYKSAVRN